MEPIRVLHLVNGLEDSSISRIILRLVMNAPKNGYCWYIGSLSGQNGLAADFQRAGAVIMNLNQGANTGSELWNLISAEQIHILHTHTIRTILQTARARNLANCLHITTKHTLTQPWDRPFGLFYSVVDHLSLYIPNRIVAVSQRMYRQIAALPLLQKKLVMIHNAIPAEDFYLPEQREAVRTALGISPDAFVIGFIGRIEAVKRLDLLLKAYSILKQEAPRLCLLIAGEGAFEKKMRAAARRLGIDGSVIWLGYRSDIPKILSALDLFVQPSENEGLSLSLLEAMAAGKPVVATDAGGTREVITDRQTGSLIPRRNLAALLAAMKGYLLSPSNARAVGEKARNFVGQYYSLQPMIHAYCELYTGCREVKETVKH